MRISDWSSDVCSSDLAEAAPLALKVGPGAHQPARLIVQMGKLHLKRAFARGRPLPEYLEDQPGPFDHLCAKRLFKVALLDRADIAVHDAKLRLMPRDVQTVLAQRFAEEPGAIVAWFFLRPNHVFKVQH